MGNFFSRWRQSFRPLKFFLALVSAFGILWTVVDVAFYVTSQSRDWVISHWWIFVALGLIWALFSGRPRNSVSHKLKGCDSVIEIKVVDIFRNKGSIVVPVNTAFDVNMGGIIVRANSVQGGFLRKYFQSNPHTLAEEIKRQIDKLGIAAQPGISQAQVYPIGTVVPIVRDGRTFYLVASSKLSENGRAVGNVDDIRIALDKLWDFICSRGDKGDVVIPVIGTGNARVSLSREDAIRQIIKSYIASSANKTYCDRLVIAVHPNDVDKFKINIDELDAFLKFSCEYANFEVGRSNGKCE